MTLTFNYCDYCGVDHRDQEGTGKTVVGDLPADTSVNALVKKGALEEILAPSSVFNKVR